MIFFNDLFKNRFFLITVFWIFIQQLLVAMGTYLMGDLSKDFIEGGLHIGKVTLLIGSFIFSGSLLHYIFKIYLKKSEKSILKFYLLKYQKNLYSNPSIWKHSIQRQERHDVMVRDGQDSIVSAVSFSADTLATVFNILFNSVSIMLATSSTLGIAIFLSGFLGLYLIHLADKKISQSASDEVEANSSLNAHLGKSWDNLVLGNKSIYNRWLEKFELLYNSTVDKSLFSSKVNESAIALAGFVTNLLVVSTVFYLIFQNFNNKANVIALIVMLPRSMQIVMHIQVIQSYWAHWKYLIQKIKITEATYAPIQDISLEAYINPSQIKISPEIHENEILKLSSGRFTMRGPNGAGKSTYLLKLKSILNENALYIPAQHNLILSQDTTSLSSGEIAKRAVEDSLIDPAEFILLDEWDANLSKENKLDLDSQIENLSRSKVVLEIRHS